MPTYHQFDQNEIEASLRAVASHYDHNNLKTLGVGGSIADSGHIKIAAATCIAVTVEDGKVCLELPLGIGKVCVPIPLWIPDGTAVEACLDICTSWGIPTGVKVEVSVLGKVIVSQSFGVC